jgi:hypothetical protein
MDASMRVELLDKRRIRAWRERSFSRSVIAPLHADRERLQVANQMGVRRSRS